MHNLVTLVGWTGAWQTRVRIADERTNVPASRITVTWMHHRAYGTIGVYWPTAVPGTMGALGTARPWVVIVGELAPCAAVAHGDDPRGASDVEAAPLLIRVAQIRRATAADRGGGVMLTNPVWMEVRKCRGVQTGVLGMGKERDIVYWSARALAPGRYPWNTVHGVVGTIGRERYLRYVVRGV
jgi:hypothetical protein